MPELITTWIIRHRRPLEPGEDPLAAGNVDPEHTLWAFDEGTTEVAVELVEQ